MNYSKELDTAKQAAYEASEIIKKYASEGFNIELKGKNDLITQADVASEKAIISVISEAYPNDLFLAEESTGVVQLTNERTWIIDPIDGTTNFAHGFPVYCISIALWEDQKPKVGLVYQVAGDELFYATEQSGAFLNNNPISVSNEVHMKNSLIGTGFPYKSLNLVDDYLALFKTFMDKTHGVRRPGSAAYDLCCVAAGRFEGFYEYGLNAWDVAAGSLIVQEAGGMITDWRGESNWLFGERIIAGNASIHAKIKEEIQLHFKESDWAIDN